MPCLTVVVSGKGSEMGVQGGGFRPCPVAHSSQGELGSGISTLGLSLLMCAMKGLGSVISMTPSSFQIPWAPPRNLEHRKSIILCLSRSPDPGPLNSNKCMIPQPKPWRAAWRFASTHTSRWPQMAPGVKADLPRAACWSLQCGFPVGVLSLLSVLALLPQPTTPGMAKTLWRDALHLPDAFCSGCSLLYTVNSPGGPAGNVSYRARNRKRCVYLHNWGLFIYLFCLFCFYVSSLPCCAPLLENPAISESHPGPPSAGLGVFSTRTMAAALRPSFLPPPFLHLNRRTYGLA